MDAPAAVHDERLCDVCEQWPVLYDQRTPVWVCGVCRDRREWAGADLRKYWRERARNGRVA